MPALIEPYTPSVYNALWEIEIVDKLVSETEIIGLGDIIIKQVFFIFFVSLLMLYFLLFKARIWQQIMRDKGS